MVAIAVLALLASPAASRAAGAGAWTVVGPMLDSRPDRPTATLLLDGQVLVTGGRDLTRLDTTELYNPATSTFSAGPRLILARSFATATRLLDGRDAPARRPDAVTVGQRRAVAIGEVARATLRESTRQ